ncbi:hypothetical protein HN011_011448 [Eciton burchellii]|nr:hypothetical protein HN011_011448 [Eciton burchellii]
MAYADLEDVKAFYKTYNECLKELGLPKKSRLQPIAIHCLHEKEDMFDEDGTIRKEKLTAHADSILLPGTEEHVNKILSECYKLGDSKNEDMEIIKCCLNHNVEDFIQPPV